MNSIDTSAVFAFAAASHLWLRRGWVAVVFTALMLAPMSAFAQQPPPPQPWSVTLTPTLNPLAIGLCGAVHLTIFEGSGGEVPRNPTGFRVTMADFDMAVSGGGVAGQRIDSTHFQVCACQGGSPGSVGTVTATYPAQALAGPARVPGVAFQKAATFVVAIAKGPVNPPPCALGGAPAVSSAAPPAQMPPAVASPPTAPPVTLATPPAVAPPPVAAAQPPASPPVAIAPATPPAPAAPPVTAAAPPAAPPATVGATPTPVAAAPPRGAAPSVAPPAAVAPTSAPPIGVTGTPAGVAPTSVPPTIGGRVAAAGPPAPTAVVPVNPSGFTAVQTAPGQVTLSWQPVSGASFYGLWGPGVANGGEKVSGATTFTATAVPGGTQEWSVGSFYEPGNVSTAMAAYTKVTLNVTVPIVAGKYLVTVTGLRVYQASMDDFLSRDGVGDEVYAAAYVRRYDQRTGQMAEVISRQSAAYGDVFHFGGQRLQAGSRSQTGGLQDGDPIPDGPLVAVRSLPAQDITFPWRLWEGTLTDGVDALVITPSLWEQDGGTAYYTQWEQQQQALNLSLFTNQKVQNQIAQKVFGPLVSGLSGNSSNNSAASIILANQDMMFVTTFGLPLGTLLSSSSDRPLGLVANGRDMTALPNHAVVLTREIIEAALALSPLGNIPSPIVVGPLGPVVGGPAAMARIGVVAPKPGIMVIQFQDANVSGTFGFPERPAIYQMYIQVERVP